MRRNNPSSALLLFVALLGGATIPDNRPLRVRDAPRPAPVPPPKTRDFDTERVREAEARRARRAAKKKARP